MINRIHLAIALAGLSAVVALAASATASKSAADRVFEMRTYVAHPGRGPAMHKRFRDHTCTLFKKHGMELVGFWTPQEENEGKADTLVYILAFPSKNAAKASWSAFQADPDWIKVRNASEEDGKIVAKVTSVYLDPTDYSSIK